ncbi:hypothetical protein P153DRAFT_325305 [Dothidotthia symphoricarpi CBS 119687]|uniref:N-acetyltransferase domain-containing protein n=1 Tax=Dothidotthia symphoricarpi CBS 119687 TaxID=1392245 RepID=A0A6A6A265_9PLEO|nr:uncharacterized protein P153DRAFT_325305 [Dothidotthia symphoricarpi CBS 119687]KAF2124997.1 hypothetical protein P153DRAFT_325305 [Dothidotthia symphoricarpi CBS 119687]
MSERYVVREVATREEMDDILEIIWAANYTPYEPFIQLFFPVLGFTPAHRKTAIAESKERFWSQHQAEPSGHWFYVVDTIAGKAVGCAQWVISTTNPFAGGVPKLKAPWWPEGECRKFCESILNQVYRAHASWMTRPHCALNWMAVHPSYRLRGIGSLLMNAGVSRADKLDLECWMEASSMGKPLYEKFDFESLFKIGFDTEKPNASDEWRKCAHEMTPPPIFAMWRPKQGSRKDEDGGEVKMPWDLAMEYQGESRREGRGEGRVFRNGTQ